MEPATETVLILGMPLNVFTAVHVAISLMGIVAGLIAVVGMLKGDRMRSMTLFFLITTILTSLTGFLFPFKAFGPPHAFGVISLPLLGLALLALYARRLTGHWRWVYIVSTLMALYLNVVVLVVQSFQKIPGLAALAPTQSEPPFLAVQLIVLGAFIWAGFVTIKKYRPSPL